MALGPLRSPRNVGPLRVTDTPEALSVSLHALARRSPSPLALEESPSPIPTLSRRPIETPQTDPDYTVEEINR